MNILWRNAFWSLCLAVSCTQHRDLYVESTPLFVVKADWSQSTISPKAATAMVFNSQKAVLSNPYMQPSDSTQSQALVPDVYDVLVFNNMMFSATDNEFSFITFKGIDHFDTFEAHATEQVKANPVFRSAPQEVIVDHPDRIAVATYRNKKIEDIRSFAVKYQDGVHAQRVDMKYVKDQVQVLPVCVTRTVQVVLRVKNYKSMMSIYGTLRGFARGVNLSTRKPVGNKATHAGFQIKNPMLDPIYPDRHILKSDRWTTFGPWWADPPGSNTYMLDLLVRSDGLSEALFFSFDVTKLINGVVTQSVEQAIQVIQAQEERYSKTGVVPAMECIPIEVWLTLPEIIKKGDGIDVGLEGWNNVVIIPVPFG